MIIKIKILKWIVIWIILISFLIIWIILISFLIIWIILIIIVFISWLWGGGAILNFDSLNITSWHHGSHIDPFISYRQLAVWMDGGHGIPSIGAEGILGIVHHRPTIIGDTKCVSINSLELLIGWGSDVVPVDPDVPVPVWPLLDMHEPNSMENLMDDGPWLCTSSIWIKVNSTVYTSLTIWFPFTIAVILVPGYKIHDNIALSIYSFKSKTSVLKSNK